VRLVCDDTLCELLRPTCSRLYLLGIPPLRSFIYLARVLDKLKCLWRRLSRLGYGVGINIPTALWEHRTQLGRLRRNELDGWDLYGVWDNWELESWDRGHI
jgi:hypothetical protein